jgi:serine/threonine protein kinase
MSPELNEKFIKSDFHSKLNYEKSDVYSLGLTLLKNYLNEKIDFKLFLDPIKGEDAKLEVLSKITDSGVRNLLQSMLIKNPEERFSLSKIMNALQFL